MGVKNRPTKEQMALEGPSVYRKTFNSLKDSIGVPYEITYKTKLR
jgi:hypothetical protein